MRPSLKRIVLQYPQSTNNCIRCQALPLNTRQFVSSTRTLYATTNDGDSGVTSTSTVPEDPDIITTESHSLQNPPSSPLPPNTPAPVPDREPWHFRLPNLKMDSATRQKELNKALRETSLRRKLHWFTPLHGVNPAYDMATIYLEQDRMEKIEIIKRLEARIAHERESNLPPQAKY